MANYYLRVSYYVFDYVQLARQKRKLEFILETIIKIETKDKEEIDKAIEKKKKEMLNMLDEKIEDMNYQFIYNLNLKIGFQKEKTEQKETIEGGLLTKLQKHKFRVIDLKRHKEFKKDIIYSEI